MSPRDMTFATLLVAAGFWAVISALLLIGAVYEGSARGSRAWTASFVVSSLVAAYAFWELL